MGWKLEEDAKFCYVCGAFVAARAPTLRTTTGGMSVDAAYEAGQHL